MKLPDTDLLLSNDFQMLIGGDLCAASDGLHLDTVNPATGKVIAQLPDASVADIDRAVKAAKDAQPAWAALSMDEKCAYLHKVAVVLRDHSAELGALDSLENGNVYSHMCHDAEGGAYMMDYFCGIAYELKGEATQLDQNVHYTRREPFGVVAKLLPFNHPIQSLAAGIAPVLLTGNTLILKPSPHTALSALRFGELIQNLLPAGVINIICGRNESVALGLMQHPDIPRLSVTGSTAVGKLAVRAGADNLKSITLELGGKTPMIVFDDADLDKSVDTAISGMNFKWQGHSCSSTSRVLVHDSLYDAFVEKLKNRFQSVNVAMPFDAEAEMGPISHEGQFNKVRDYIELGQGEGATLVCGGERIMEGEMADGFFLTPAIFADVTKSMRIAQEEIYGPVISIMRWQDDEEAIEIANDTPYGLMAVIMGGDVSRIHKTAYRLKCGYVEVNGPVSFALGSPYGGMKSSGVGREGNMEELLSYTQLKSININL